MKFYLCQTDDGPQYIHLQIDAKKLDPNFETVEIDLSKEAIMNRLNDLMRRAHGNIAVFPDASPEEEKDPAGVSPPPDRQPSRSDQTEAQIAWEEFIFAIPVNEAYRLNTLQEVIEARRSEIEREENQDG